MAAEPSSRSCRRYLRFSLRGLIVLVLVIGCGLGWIVRSARIQREAVAAIQKVGGTVYYDWEWAHGSQIPNGKPWCPNWLVDRLGIDYIGHVTRVEMPNTSPVTTIAQIGRLAQLEELDLPSAHVSDAAMVHLRGLKSLEVLNLLFTRITDAGLAPLADLTSLKTLYLDGTDVTDAGLGHFKGLSNLTKLYLSLAPVSDAGLAPSAISPTSRNSISSTPRSPTPVWHRSRALPRSLFSTFARRRSATPVWHV